MIPHTKAFLCEKSRGLLSAFTSGARQVLPNKTILGPLTCTSPQRDCFQVHTLNAYRTQKLTRQSQTRKDFGMPTLWVINPLRSISFIAISA
jgi:hypothetical protein